MVFVTRRRGNILDKIKTAGCWGTTPPNSAQIGSVAKRTNVRTDDGRTLQPYNAFFHLHVRDCAEVHRKLLAIAFLA